MRQVPGVLVPIRKSFAERTAPQHLGLGLISRVFGKRLEPDFPLTDSPCQLNRSMQHHLIG
jgi:hypothetical protein